MALHYEIEPTSKREKLVEQFLKLKGLVDKVNVPENPLGQLKPSSLAISILAKELGLEPVLHLRSRDRNFLNLKSEIYGAIIFDIKDILIVKGDIKEDKDYETKNEEKLEVIAEKLKSDEKISKLRIGLPLIKLVMYDERVKARLSSCADFFVTLQINGPEDVPEELLDYAKKNNKKIQSYYLLISDNNKVYLKSLGFEVKEKSIKQYIEDVTILENMLDAVILSCPRDFNFLLEFLNKYNKR